MLFESLGIGCDAMGSRRVRKGAKSRHHSNTSTINPALVSDVLGPILVAAVNIAADKAVIEHNQQ